MSADRAEALPYPVVIKLASVLSLEEDGAFIVGGQALNLWAERYADNCPELAGYGPFTSKDIDYFGHRDAAQKLANALDGKAIFPHPDDHTPNTALVCATLEGRAVEVDFLYNVIGVRAPELEREAVELRVPLRYDAGHLDIPVMHPLHCLQSRVANVVTLGRRDEVAMRQLHAAPIVLQKYIEEMISGSNTREVQRTLQGLFLFLRSDRAGLEAPALPMRDPLEIIAKLATDTRLDWRYRWFNVRSMRWKIVAKRLGLAASKRKSHA